jgi:glycosyltransferase involved in cell wall biosynthesis
LKTPIVLIEQNIEYLLYKRQVEIQKNLVLRIGMQWDVWKMRREEVLFWKRARYLGGLSLLDNAEIRSVTGRQDLLLLENGVNLAWFSEKLGLIRKKNRVLFVGSFSYFANVDALIWLLEDIWPRFITKHKSTEVELHIVGRGADANLKDLVSKNGMVIDESVEDIRVAFQEATVLVAPLRAGSGTKYKILEAMASHCPVLTTDVGAEGLKVSNGKQLIVENESAKLADMLGELIANESMREQLTLQGYNFVKEYYDWPKVISRFEEQLNQN